jgi:hypothetical protein
VDGRVGFEAAVSAATGELRAGVAVERGAAAGLRRAIMVLRGDVARSCEVTVRMQAERDAARALAARQATDMAALQQVVSELRRDLAAAAAERDALLPASDAFAAAGSSLLWRNGDALLDDAACGLWLRLQGFPAGSQPAGITWGLEGVEDDDLRCSGHEAINEAPRCRLLFEDASDPVWFDKKDDFQYYSPWMSVDLGGQRSVVGALVQSWEETEKSSHYSACWHGHKFQWSADGAAWADVDGGHEWSREGYACKDVSAEVFSAPVRCRHLRVVSQSGGGYLRWEVVVLP